MDEMEATVSKVLEAVQKLISFQANNQSIQCNNNLNQWLSKQWLCPEIYSYHHYDQSNLKKHESCHFKKGIATSGKPDIILQNRFSILAESSEDAQIDDEKSQIAEEFGEPKFNVINIQNMKKQAYFFSKITLPSDYFTIRSSKTWISRFSDFYTMKM